LRVRPADDGAGLWGMSEAEARRSSKADHVYRDLKESILSGALEPGGAIDKLALCERLGVSRFPVSSAISRLAYERLVTIEPQHGSFVAKISIDDVRERLMVRRALESEVAEQAALRMPREGMEEMERNLRYQQAAVDGRDVAGFYALDVDFHRLFPALLTLRHCGEVLDGLRSHLERVRRLLLSPAGRMPKTLAEHSAIAKAVTRGDAAGARAAMHHHLQQTTDLFENFARERASLFSR
jgi:GntR family transcriptional regulator, rspAB operon transcriptional repressor